MENIGKQFIKLQDGTEIVKSIRTGDYQEGWIKGTDTKVIFVRDTANALEMRAQGRVSFTSIWKVR